MSPTADTRPLRTVISVIPKANSIAKRTVATDEVTSEVGSDEERESTLSSIIQAGMSEIEPITAREIRNRKRSYPSYILELKPSRTELKPFIVADTETILIDNEHKPYAAGLLLVRPGEQINDLTSVGGILVLNRNWV